MRSRLAIIIIIVASAGAAGGAPAAPPTWAFPVPPEHAASSPAPDPARIEHVAGSKRTYTVAQLSERYAAPNWFPESHPPMPRAVEFGAPPGAMPCAYCHQETGEGGPESAALTGLAAAYIVEQVREFRAGMELRLKQQQGALARDDGPVFLGVRRKALHDPVVAHAADGWLLGLRGSLERRLRGFD